MVLTAVEFDGGGLGRRRSGQSRGMNCGMKLHRFGCDLGKTSGPWMVSVGLVPE